MRKLILFGICYNIVQMYPSNKRHIYRKLPAAPGRRSKAVSQHLNRTPLFMPHTVPLPLLFGPFRAWRPDERSGPTSDLQQGRDVICGALAGARPEVAESGYSCRTFQSSAVRDRVAEGRRCSQALGRGKKSRCHTLALADLSSPEA